MTDKRRGIFKHHMAGWMRKCSASTFSATAELIVNGGFETAGAGDPDFFASWAETIGDGVIADEGTLVKAGSHAAKVTASASLRSGNITVATGAKYLLSFWTRGDGTRGGRYGVYDSSQSSYTVAVVDTSITGTTYTAVTKAFTVPAGCTAINIDFSATTLGIAYFDVVSLKRISDDE